MRTIVKRVLFEEMTVDYINMTEEPHNKIEGKHLTGRTNPETWSLMKDRFVVLRNFIPESITNMALDAWKTIESNEEVDAVIFHKEHEITQGSPKESLGKSKAGYCTPHGVALHRWLGDELKGIIDMDLRETYSYTRKYDRGAYLRAHTDRPSCEISTTICLDYKSDDNTPWKIWVQKDKNWVDEGADIELLGSVSQELPHRDRVGTPISLEVGDVLLYQGPNAIHWRDRFLGEYSYHMFLHFINGIGRTVDMPNAKGKVDRGVDPRNAGVFSYDGRPNRYAPESEKSVQFEKAMDAWNNWDEKKYGKKSDYLNNYSHITVVEEKKKK